jgi:glyoxylase-like metal-dependent hydrolase (beta-lactamase superfamily II)
MKIQDFYHGATFTLSYVVYDENTKDAVVIDPAMDYNPNSGQYSHTYSDKIIEFVKTNDLKVHYILETHAHADHLTDSVYLKEQLGGKTAISENIKGVQAVFKDLFNLKDLKTDGSQFDVLVKEGETVKAGSLTVNAINTPGHTPACVTYHIGDALFTGDALFMEDMGTGRCDFPKGSADDLYVSIHDKLYNLPDETRVFVGHDYQPGGRDLKFETTIGKSKKLNPQLKGETSREDFVKYRTTRDSELDAPKLLLPSIQINVNAGHFPEAEDNGLSYLKIPLRQK